MATSSFWPMPMPHSGCTLALCALTLELLSLSLGHGLLLTKSFKQKVATKSSTEAELIALSDATSLTAHQIQFLDSQVISLAGYLYQDSTPTTSLAKNGRSNSDRTRHTKTRYLFVKQYLDSGEVNITYCPTIQSSSLSHCWTSTSTLFETYCLDT